MSEYYTIGTICKKTGITKSTLRFYESMGIIKPSYVDENTGYRYYSPEDFWEIEIVKMCKKLNFPLKKIKEMQDKQDINELLKFINIQKFRARKELLRYQAVYDDITWLEETWNQIAKMDEYIDPEPCIKALPERKVIMTTLKKEDRDNLKTALDQMPILQMQIQNLAAEELKLVYSIKSNYGYKLDLDKFNNNEVNLFGEYVQLPKYHVITEKKLSIIPAGNYVCITTRMFTENDWIEKVHEYLKKNNLKAKEIYASEISLYFFDWRNTLHQIEILI